MKTQQQQHTQHEEVRIVTTQHSEGHPALLSSGETLHLLEGHVSRHSELAQHPPVVLNLLTRELLLHHLYRADQVVNLINKMLEISLLNISILHAIAIIVTCVK